ncbi:hypothetical protein PPSIR1_31218, partial [Plesiocystis pacifica SIR-1]
PVWFAPAFPGAFSVSDVREEAGF